MDPVWDVTRVLAAVGLAVLVIEVAREPDRLRDARGRLRPVPALLAVCSAIVGVGLLVDALM